MRHITRGIRRPTQGANRVPHGASREPFSARHKVHTRNPTRSAAKQSARFEIETESESV
ncbi:hypothetical protein V9W64_10715 [Neisseria leonii]|uniref:Uncharacterized protein n=1 Tax=Neisseria leonii TaxID=2995413 RepID=A0A9X4E4T9_9NEIS|nr:hypothetical protein [Neisseria sp. 51.81]MDD9328800.1 hypothetical protein [Neisseria sp. 51.81]